MLLGVDGVVVVGHGASGADAVAACIGQAAGAVRDDVLPRLRASLADLWEAAAGAPGLVPAP
jgi:fatty acid/phospholipid biosynthesis enzyme